MKIIHTSDLHLGSYKYGNLNPKTGLNTRLEDLLKAFQKIINFAIENSCEFFFICGDIFKRKNPTSIELREFVLKIKQLLENKIKVIILIGNHDFSSLKLISHSLEAFKILDIKNLFIVDKPILLSFKIKFLKIGILAIPYIESKGKFKEMISKFAIIKNKYDLRILLSHISIKGSEVGAQDFILDSEEDFNFENFRKKSTKRLFNYIGLGHIHKHQRTQIGNLTENAMYSGSIEKINFAERKEDKGFIIIDAYLEEIFPPEFKKIKTRKFIQLIIRRYEDLKNHKNIKNSIVKIIIKNSEIDNVLVRAKLIKKGVAKILIERKIKKKIIKRMEINEEENLEEIFRRYLKNEFPSNESKNPRLFKTILDKGLEILKEAATI